jgi:hypothetical protein
MEQIIRLICVRNKMNLFFYDIKLVQLMKNVLFLLLTIALFAVSYQADAQTISGASTLCTGTSLPLTGSPSGGTWSSSDVGIADVATTTGVISGIVAGTATITYTVPALGFATQTVTVYASPGIISGPSIVCKGTSTLLSCGTTGGSWSSSNILIATIGVSSGLFSGISAGISTITYTIGTSGCSSFKQVTVNPAPATITGNTNVCMGSTTTLANTTSGGTWESSDPTISSIDATTGVATGVAAGISTISYTIANGCYATQNVVVNNLPALISGASTVCNGSYTVLNDATPGGVWATSNPSVAVINATGVVSGLTIGTATISYTATTGCYRVHTITSNANPGAITGTMGICIGSGTTLSDATTGGVWASSNTAIATIGTGTGVVTSTGAGATSISYTLANGCSTAATITVNPIPLPISGAATVCEGASSVFSSPSPGGLWLSGSTSIATVGAGSGSTTTLTGVLAGTTTISYITGSSCVTATSVTILAGPVAGTITGPAVICIGSPASLSASAGGGAWTSSVPGIISVSGTGVVSGFGIGSGVISYAVSNSCGTAYATLPVSAALAPAPITGTATMCTGTSTTLSETSTGGSWSSASTGIAMVSATGSVSGTGTGTVNISYAYSSACYVTKNVTVDATPSPIAGTGPVCIGAVLGLSDALSGGTWASSNPAVASISTLGVSTGVVTGYTAGTSSISYIMGSGCLTSTIVTVYPLPVITASATAAVCGGTYLAVAGGGITYSWYPSAGVACDICATTSINPIASGTYSVTGTGASGCQSTAVVTVAGDRMYGHIHFSGPAPSTLGMKVWLIQYNPADSSLTATDSLITCLDGASPFYQFNSKPSGNYMIKGKLLSSLPGTSDYVPTYASSTTSWSSAATIVHSGASDSTDINMLYGSVPAGSGFISGNVYSGAGKGTTGEIPVGGMLVYLRNATTDQVLAYTYTSAAGVYSFTGIAFGDYVVYPEEFSYYTTASGTISLNTAHPNQLYVDFKEHTNLRTITPFVNGTEMLRADQFALYPNPTTGMINIRWNQPANNVSFNITDVTGREVYKTNITSAGQGDTKIDLSDISSGIYFYTIQIGESRHSGKILMQKH